MQLVTPTNPQQYWNLLNALDHETEFMMYEPGERSSDLSMVTRLVSSPRSETFLIAAEHEGELVGFLSANRGNHNRTRHSAYIVCGVRAKYRRQGLGTKFFEALNQWAKEQKIHRLELTVMCENTAAIRLYQKSGFEIEGTSRHTMRVNGIYKDEYQMSKIIPEEA